MLYMYYYIGVNQKVLFIRIYNRVLKYRVCGCPVYLLLSYRLILTAQAGTLGSIPGDLLAC